jgi:hypothetical protein
MVFPTEIKEWGNRIKTVKILSIRLCILETWARQVFSLTLPLRVGSLTPWWVLERAISFYNSMYMLVFGSSSHACFSNVELVGLIFILLIGTRSLVVLNSIYSLDSPQRSSRVFILECLWFHWRMWYYVSCSAHISLHVSGSSQGDVWRFGCMSYIPCLHTQRLVLSILYAFSFTEEELMLRHLHNSRVNDS